MPDLLKVEFHCHTLYSPDSLTTIRELLARCEVLGIDRIVITDHNVIGGAVEAQALDPQRVIVGEEIKTTQGELLAAYVTEEVPRGLPPEEAIARLREQRAFISVSHPYDARGGRWSDEGRIALADQVDAVEVFNARCLHQDLNDRALVFAEAHGLLGTVGSDAHTLREVGRATMRLPYFEDAVSLKAALAGVQYDNQRAPFGARFMSNYAKLAKLVRRT
jgi:hypothetical protein